MKYYWSHQHDFKIDDLDGDGKRDYAPDLQTLKKAIEAKSGKTAESFYCAVDMASAVEDYYYVPIVTKTQGGAAGASVRFLGLCAVPASYRRNTFNTYIIGESGKVYGKDNSGKPADSFPEDPLADGWWEP